MPNNSKVAVTGLPPLETPVGRRIYARAIQLTRRVVQVGLFLVSPVVGAVLLKLLLGIAGVFLAYALGGVMPGPSFMTSGFWETLSRTIPWSLAEIPSVWWLLAGAAVTWWPLLRD